MVSFPRDPKKIQERIRRYERELRQEQKTYGGLDDGAGKRYLLGPLYLAMGDLPGALKSFKWFEKMFPDDIGEPFFLLSWALALYRSGNMAKAEQKLRRAMLSNLYMIPHLLGIEQNEIDIWHDSNWAQKDYLQYAPPQIWQLWDEPARQWARELYNSPEFSQVRERYIEIYRQLKDEPPGPRRSQLVEEAFELEGVKVETDVV